MFSIYTGIMVQIQPVNTISMKKGWHSVIPDVKDSKWS